MHPRHKLAKKRHKWVSFPLLAFLFAAISIRPAVAQSENGGAGEQQGSAGPEINRVVAETVNKLVKTDLRIILTTPLSSCLAAPQLCREFDAALRSELKKSLPGVQFVEREDAIKYLEQHGFMTIDAYMGALDDVAWYAGAEAVVGEGTGETKNKCELRTTLVDSRHRYQLGDSSARIPCSAIGDKRTLSVLKDPATGVFLIVSLPESSDSPPFALPIRYPSCVRCPEPKYSGFARSRRIQGSVHLLGTVTEQGQIRDIRILGGVEESLERVSFEAVRDWQFKPALDRNGKSFPVRVEIEMNFRMVP